MKTKNSQAGDAHAIIIGLIVIVIIGALGFVAWKQFNKNDAATPKATTGDSKHPDATTTEHKTPAFDLSFKTPFKTDNQGDCHLSMSDKTGKEVLTQDNSTKDKKGETGCEEWKLYTAKLPRGDYKVTVTFDDGHHNKLTSTSTIPLK